ncbi:hypothetical protein GBF38_000031 [Nibea albiflora]|nr:hypothetical protein GBF38_000031 [Nibea albiflora]
MFINKEKETRRELESLKKYTDPETLSTAKMCQPSQRHHQEEEEEELLQVDYEELQVAHIVNEGEVQQ